MRIEIESWMKHIDFIKPIPVHFHGHLSEDEISEMEKRGFVVVKKIYNEYIGGSNEYSKNKII